MPTKPAKTYDSACEILAEYFLGTERNSDEVRDLAQHVQDAVEEWIGDWERRNEAASEKRSEPDDSSYRRDMINSGRGHLLR